MMENIFILNPLTALFLSGVGTQLFVLLVCDNDQRTKEQRRGTHLKKQSDKRMDRWQICFTNICRELFDIHYFEDEKTQFQGNLILDPFEVHLTLLTKHSEAILYFAERNNLGKSTLKNVKKWFELMVSSLDKSSLGNKFDASKLRALIDMSKTHLALPTSTSPTHHTILAKEYPHFSPGALYIRSAYVLHIHKHKFHHTLMYSWENCSAKIMSKFLKFSDYLNESADDDDMDHSLPYFPYIYHLPCKKLDQIWNLSDQISKPVPFDHIFEQINMCIYGKATTFHTSNPLHSRYNEHAEDQISSLQRILMEASEAINMEMKLVRNCEKQKRHQNKKKESQFENIYTKRSRQGINPLNPHWSCPFLFPAKYFLLTDNTAGTETFAC
jgi:hypothetical protein